MRLGRFILSLLLATIAGGTVLLWPQSPLWMHTFSAIPELVQFSQDGKSLIVAEGWYTNSVPTAAPSLVFFDLKTGNVSQRLPLTFPPGTFIHKYWLTPDAQTIIAQVPQAKEGSNESIGGTSLVAYDVATSKQLREPLPSSHLHNLEFSPDRRWFWYIGPGSDVPPLEVKERKDYASNAGLRNIIHIASAADFRNVLSIPYNPSTQAFHNVGFLADQNRIAVLYTVWPGKPLLEIFKESPEKLEQLQQMLEVWDLQTGKKTHSSLMPATHRWYAIEKAIDKNIYIRGSKVNTLKAAESLSEVAKVSWVSDKELITSLEPQVSSLRREASFTANFVPATASQHCMGFGDDWVCHSIIHDRDNVAIGSALRWIDAKAGTNLMDRAYPGHTICVKERPSGKTRIEIVVKAGLNMRISDDGQYLAQANYIHKTLELWNANPSSRWPYAVAAGVLICIMMLFERKRKVNREIASQPSK